MNQWLSAPLLLLALASALACAIIPPAQGAVAETPVNSAFTRHLSDLTNNVPPGFTVIVQPPFVVLGDESPDVVNRRATQTVKWAVDKLKQDYFQRDPQEIIDIWLFKDGASYTNHAKLLFDDSPSSRFGYYSAANHALIMNIAT